jgi:hypothetical protein
MFATSLGVLGELATTAEASRSHLSSLLKTQQQLSKVNRVQLLVARKHLDFAQRMSSYRWILENPDFQRWRVGGENRYSAGSLLS